MNLNHQSGVSLNGVQIAFGSTTAVHPVTIDVGSGEFFTLLGPSGCGKTTLLRTIAGFYRQQEGTISVGSLVLDDLPAHKRDTGMVFQNYAVFPHLNVRNNIAFGLKKRGVRGKELRERVNDAIALVDLDGLEDRMPKQLSGGQQQRLVIARAVVIRPRVLLMDEPLANLDAKLRVRLRNDLKALQAKLGITTIYVTHDQEEALSLSDRIAVMSAGRVLQVGTPQDIYERPSDLGVAEFIGEGSFFRGNASPGRVVTLANGRTLEARGHGSGLTGEVWIGFRPNDVRATPGPHEPNAMDGTVLSKMYLGSYVRLELECGLEKPIHVQTDASDALAATAVGGVVSISIPPGAVMVFPGTDREAEL